MILESLKKLLQSNTLLGGSIPPNSNIFQQLEAISQFGFPFEQYDGSDTIMFSSPFWDNINRYPVTRQVFGVEQFIHRTQLLLNQMGYDPYSFDTVRTYKPIGLSTFPESKGVFMPNTFKNPNTAMEVVRDYVRVTDTTVVVSLKGLNKTPIFTVQSVFNPYFAYLRQRQKDICVSPDLIAQQALQSKPLLEHKNQENLQTNILNGFSPIVGLYIMPENGCQVSCLPSGYPYLDKDITPVQEQEKQKADPGNFEL